MSKSGTWMVETMNAERDAALARQAVAVAAEAAQQRDKACLDTAWPAWWAGIGSALETVADTAALGEQDVRTLRANAAREAWGYRAQAVGFTAQGRSASYLSRAASVNSLLNFGAGLATGASRGDYYLGKNSGPG